MRTLLPAIALTLCLAVAGEARARAWSRAEVEQLIEAGQEAPNEGLAAPAMQLGAAQLTTDLADLDPNFAALRSQAASGLFCVLATEYARGAVNPSAADPDWRIEPPPAPDCSVLEQSLDAGSSVSAALSGLLPQSREYQSLRAELIRLASEHDAEEEHIGRLRANLERLRWLPRTMPTPRLEVRIAEFALHFYRVDGGEMTRDVIVGSRANTTPTIAASMDSVTLNPDWNPPAGIAYGELLPRFRRNPSAAVREGYEAVDANGNAIDAANVNWSARPFPYQIRQRPGPANALGRIRFNLPNPYAVYLHDTPGKSLFDRTDRALSHGCVRVRDPVPLGAEVLAQPDQAALEAEIATGVSQDLPLPAPVPVYLLYLTTAVQPDGSITYLNDIYRRDDAILRALGHAENASAQAAAARVAAAGVAAMQCAVSGMGSGR
jgi:murein L,D-transpeptidase YcbB/YkuD